MYIFIHAKYNTFTVTNKRAKAPINRNQQAPECLRIAEREPAPAAWANSLSCIRRRCRSSSSRRRAWASAARSGGRTATVVSSMSASTCCRRELGREARKLTGSTGASALAGVVCCCCRAAILACSVLCWASTCQNSPLKLTPNLSLEIKYKQRWHSLVMVQIFSANWCWT